jgi:hypothetical protein
LPPVPADLLSPDELRRAADARVWIVWWEEPEKSWEAICLGAAEADRLFAARESDPTLRSWGKVGRRDPQSLLQWLEGHLQAVHASSAGDYADAAREVLGRLAADRPGPLVLRSW